MCIEVVILRDAFQTNADVTKGRFYPGNRLEKRESYR